MYPIMLYTSQTPAVNAIASGTDICAETGTNCTMITSSWTDSDYRKTLLTTMARLKRPVWLSLGGPLPETTLRAVVNDAKAALGANLAGVMLWDEPPMTDRDALNAQCKAIRLADPALKIWLNTTANPAMTPLMSLDTDVHSIDLYQDCTPNGDWCNELSTIRELTEVWRAAADKIAPAKMLGFIAQAFAYQHPRRTYPLTVQMMRDVFNTVRGAFGAKLDIYGLYAWKNDSSYQIHAAQNSTLRPTIREFAAWLGAQNLSSRLSIGGGTPVPDTMTIIVPPGISKVVLEVQR